MLVFSSLVDIGFVISTGQTYKTYKVAQKTVYYLMPKVLRWKSPHNKHDEHLETNHLKISRLYYYN